MRSKLCGLLLPAALLLGGCAVSGGQGQNTEGGRKVAETPQGTPTPAAAARPYSKNLDELRAAFNRDKGRVRLVTLLSPT
jgi:hypothetical protein